MGGYVSKTVPDKRQGISFKTIFFLYHKENNFKKTLFHALAIDSHKQEA